MSEVPRIDLPDDSPESGKRLSEYVGRLFNEGELFDVVAITQKELQDHPMNLDMLVYRACACLVLQVSGTVKVDTELVAQAIDQLNLIAELMNKTSSYDDSLNFYIALGYLVLQRSDLADRTIGTLHLSYDTDGDALDYYDERKNFWLQKNNFSAHSPGNLPLS